MYYYVDCGTAVAGFDESPGILKFSPFLFTSAYRSLKNEIIYIELCSSVAA